MDSILEILRYVVSTVWEELQDWPVGTVIGILLSICLLMMGGIIAYGLFVAFDSWFRPRLQGVGRVGQKTFTPQHTTYTYNVALKMLTPQTYPDDWSVAVELDGKCDSISISEELFDCLRGGEAVSVTYIYGRLSRSLYIKEIAKT